MSQQNIENVENITEEEARALARFFKSYFFADDLQDPSDLDEALSDYATSEVVEDPGAKLLLNGVDKLIAQSLSEERLVELVETEWRSDGRSAVFNYTYEDVLERIRAYLRQRLTHGEG